MVNTQLNYGPGFYDEATFQRCNLGNNDLEPNMTSATYRYTENPLIYGSSIQPWVDPPVVYESGGEMNVIGNDAYMTYRRKNSTTRVGIPIRFWVDGYKLPTPMYYIDGTQFSYKLQHVPRQSFYQFNNSVIYNSSMPDPLHSTIPDNTAFGASFATLNPIGWFPFIDHFDFNVTPPYVACVLIDIPAQESLTGEQIIKFTPYGAMEAITVSDRTSSGNLPLENMEVFQGDIFIRISLASN